MEEPSAMFGGAAAIALADDPKESAEEYARPVFGHATDIAGDYDAEIETVVETGHPVRAIVNRAGDVDTVVFGSHPGTLSDRLFVGNDAEKVVHRSPVPVTVVQ